MKNLSHIASRILAGAAWLIPSHSGTRHLGGRSIMETIRESAVRLRVDPLNWPAELPRTEYPALSKAIEAAADVFTRF